MTYYITDEVTYEELLQLKAERLELGLVPKRGEGLFHSYAHLKSLLFDFRVENHFENVGTHLVAARDKETNKVLGASMLTVTKREPKHASFRHVFVFEESRGQGIAKEMYDYRIRLAVKEGATRIRLFANIPSVDWHKKCGMRFIGQNKRKQPFTYLPLFDVKSVKELGEKYDEIGFDKLTEMIEPEVSKQMDRIVSKGGKRYTSFEE